MPVVSMIREIGDEDFVVIGPEQAEALQRASRISHCDTCRSPIEGEPLYHLNIDWEDFIQILGDA